MTPVRALRVVGWAVPAALPLAASIALANGGDGLCDVAASTPEVCVVRGAHTVPHGTLLAFTAPAVLIDGRIEVAFEGTCALDQELPCATDTQCGASAPCVRRGEIGIVATQDLSISARGRVLARGQVLAGDTGPHDGGRIVLAAPRVSIAGEVAADTQRRPGFSGGDGGEIVLDASDEVHIATGADVDVSAPAGGCGGRIAIGTATSPAVITIEADLELSAATRGGSLQVVARDSVFLAGRHDASNIDRNPATRPPCLTGAPGGGRVAVQAPHVTVAGAIDAVGREAWGGTVDVIARSIEVSSTRLVAIAVSGGDVDAFRSGGAVLLMATGGDIVLSGGAIVADGSQRGLGSDAGNFRIVATSVDECQQSGVACTTDVGCEAGDFCLPSGGNVEIGVALSARGGEGFGFGCLLCAISGDGSVRVSGRVDVGGGLEGGGNGSIDIRGGTRVTVGPGSIVADGADGGEITVGAAEQSSALGALPADIRLSAGTRIRATGVAQDGFGGEVMLDGCHVVLEEAASVRANGGSSGRGGLVAVRARESVDVGDRVVLEALPDGEIRIVHRAGVTIAPDVSFTPAPVVEEDPTMDPCPECGNGIVEGIEECDGIGSCPVSEDTCVGTEFAFACRCIDTCGAMPGVQPGEQCDGADLAGATCLSLGFVGGSLRCTDQCVLDTAACAVPACGDGIMSPPETCDGGAIPDFGGATCETLGFPAGGELTCSTDCTTIIAGPHCSVSVDVPCEGDADCPEESCDPGCHHCGNGFVDPGEECDMGAENSDVAPDACRTDCTQAVCGDGVVDPGRGEVCEAAAPCCTATCEPVICDDVDPCTDDRCDDELGCVSLVVAGRSCDDSDRCTGQDACAPDGACTGAPLRGLEWLACGAPGDLPAIVAEIGAVVSTRTSGRLRRAAERIVERLDRAAVAVPAARARRPLRKARGVTRMLLRMLGRLEHRRGVEAEVLAPARALAATIEIETTLAISTLP